NIYDNINQLFCKTKCQFFTFAFSIKKDFHKIKSIYSLFAFIKMMQERANLQKNLPAKNTSQGAKFALKGFFSAKSNLF
ncbi:MAG: hypothetical protein J6Q55_01380, partial [Clostridia bacterium]|nr:hypothetical protein [Clostridia bacterium]